MRVYKCLSGEVSCAAVVLFVLSACCADNVGAARHGGHPTGTVVTCEDVCVARRALGCPAGKATPAGARCEEVCHNVQDSGIFVMDLECRAKAKTCEAMDACATQTVR